MAQSASTSWFARSVGGIGRVACLVLLFGLAGCMVGRVAEPVPSQQAPVVEPAPLSAPTSPVIVEDLTRPADDRVRVALLLPLSGSSAKLGEALLRGAEMALFDIADDRLTLLIKDTGDTPEGARAAAESAVAEGARLILGPLFGPQVAAAGPVARAAAVPMISFSTDPGVSGNGVWIMGILPKIQVERVVGYTVSRGLGRIAVLAPDTAYGDAVVSAFYQSAARTGAVIGQIQRYAPEATDLSPLVLALGQEMDAVLLPEGGNRARLLAPLLAYHDIDPANVKFLGTALWDDSTLGLESTLVGGWFAAPDPGPWTAFSSRYSEVYAEPPPRLASLSYDGTALAAVLGRGPSGPDYSVVTLTQPNGYAGVDGIFRLTADGGVERGLAVLEVRPEGPAVIDPAPKTFEELGF
ncbi:MAG: penicillin-binding protein activator [Rhodospirillales bacterium]|nr:penicillin-binding protein activator [Rhodospirillales bacterium]